MDSEIVEALIEAGGRSAPAMDLADSGEINRKSPQFWYDIAEGLELEQLIDLIRGLTLTEREFRWLGGSAAGVIWLFRYIERNHPESVESVANWVIAHRGNDYIPYGTIVLYGETHAENLEILKDKRRRQRIHSKTEAEAQQRKALRDQQRQQAATHSALIRGTDRHQELISEVSALSRVQQLEFIASHDEYSITLYPKNLAAGPLEGISTGLKNKLLEKMSGQKLRGPWAKFRKRLKEYEP